MGNKLATFVAAGSRPLVDTPGVCGGPLAEAVGSRNADGREGMRAAAVFKLGRAASATVWECPSEFAFGDITPREAASRRLGSDAKVSTKASAEGEQTGLSDPAMPRSSTGATTQADDLHPQVLTIAPGESPGRLIGRGFAVPRGRRESFTIVRRRWAQRYRRPSRFALSQRDRVEHTPRGDCARPIDGLRPGDARDVSVLNEEV